MTPVRQVAQAAAQHLEPTTVTEPHGWSRILPTQHQHSFPDRLTAVGNTLFFKATNGQNGFELWKSNGTSSGTVMVKDINSGSLGQATSNPNHLTEMGGTLYLGDGGHFQQRPSTVEERWDSIWYGYGYGHQQWRYR